MNRISVFQPYSDTASISICLFPLIDPSMQFIDLRNMGALEYNTLDIVEPDECGSYFAQKVSEALKEIESDENLPTFNTVEELLDQLKK